MISTIILIVVWKLRDIFAEILIVDKACLRKDLNFFHVCTKDQLNNGKVYSNTYMRHHSFVNHSIFRLHTTTAVRSALHAFSIFPASIY